MSCEGPDCPCPIFVSGCCFGREKKRDAYKKTIDIEGYQCIGEEQYVCTHTDIGSDYIFTSRYEKFHQDCEMCDKNASLQFTIENDVVSNIVMLNSETINQEIVVQETLQEPECAYCGKTPRSKSILQRCHFCSTTYYHKTCVYHDKEHHFPVVCGQCFSANFRGYFPCEICTKVFSSNELYNDHVAYCQIKRKKVTPSSFCALCKMKFPNPNKKKTHDDIHHEEQESMEEEVIIPPPELPPQGADDPMNQSFAPIPDQQSLGPMTQQLKDLNVKSPSTHQQVVLKGNMSHIRG